MMGVRHFFGKHAYRLGIPLFFSPLQRALLLSRGIHPTSGHDDGCVLLLHGSSRNFDAHPPMISQSSAILY